MQITRKGKKYILDIEKAIELGVLKAKSRPIKISDIPNGTVFKYQVKGEPTFYLMVDNEKNRTGQCVAIRDCPVPAFFSKENLGVLSFLDPETMTWISEVED